MAKFHLQPLHDLCFQTFCVACAKPGPWVCGECEKEFPYVRFGHCSVCGVPFVNSKLTHPCFHCASKPPAYAKHRAPFYYAHPVEELIKNFKYKAEFWVRQFYKVSIDKIVAEFQSADVIVPIPLHLTKLRARGFNQSQFLAEVWQDKLRKPLCLGSLLRVEDTPAQVDLGKMQRLKSLRHAFCVQAPEQILGKTVVLVDDVHTTGSTLHTAAGKLLEAGAKAVWATSFAIVRENS